MKRKLKDIVFGRTYGDIAVQHALRETLTELVKDLTPETIHAEEVDIVLTIDGVEYNHEKFFKMLSEAYFKHVQKAAKDLIIEKTLDSVDELRNSLEILRGKVEGLGDNIDRDMRVLRKNIKE